MANKNIGNPLVELHRSGYEIVEGEPDIRAWRVKNGEGITLGIVDELLFDPTVNKVRYIVLDMEGKKLNLVSREILVPIGIAEINELDKEVLLPQITIQQLATLPDYKRGNLTFETERKIREIFAEDQRTSTDNEEYTNEERFYEHKHFDDSRYYKKGIRKGKDFDTQNDLQRTTEESSADEERTPLNTNDKHVNKEPKENAFAPFKEGTIEITEKSEVPVVSKEARVVEEISVNKEVTEHEEKVKDSVRKTEVDIEKLPPKD